MANGTFLRGEVYWVSLDDSIGSETKTGRPAVVVSANGINDKINTVVVAFLTTGSYPTPTHPSVVSPDGIKRRVLCEQIRAVDKSRLVRYDSTLTEPELIRVTGALASLMCIPLPQNTNDKYEEEIAALKTEITVLQRLYDKAIDRIVATKLEADILSRTQTPDEDVEYIEELPEPEAEAVVEFEPEPEKVDVNTCSAEDLKKCGCVPSLANAIISNRPYVLLEDIRKVDGMTTIAWGILRHKLCCVPIEVEEPEVCELANINTDSALEICNKTGLEMTVCYSITGTRKKNGPYKSVEDLLNVKKFLPRHLELFGAKMTVGDVVEQESTQEARDTGKVNINTATPKELMEKLGINEFYAYTIVRYRKNNGRYVDLEELKEVYKLPKVFYERYKDRLTIDEDEAPTAEPESEPEVQKDRKVNVNTATAEEITEVTGMSIQTAKVIESYVKKNGPIKSLEELLNTSRFGKGSLKTHGAKMTVGEVEEPENKKLNINAASMYDLMEIGFEKRAAALIVSERKKFGNYRDVEELAEIPEISGKILRKLRDKLEV